ncbi:hypothetical protein SGRIM119S_06325 [Streptomyces griseorubiginosus]
MAPTTEVQDQQVTAERQLKPWVAAVRTAKGRTSDDLGTKYPKISEQLWKAVQSALSGSTSPKDALDRSPVRRQVVEASRSQSTNRTTQAPDRRGPSRTGAATSAPAPAHARARRRPTSPQWAAWAFLAPVTLYLGLFYAYPLYRNLDLSLRDYTVRSFVQGDAPFTGLANYRKILDDPTFAPALLHTAVFTAVCLVFQYAIGLALAVFFHQNFRLSATLRALFLVPWLLPLIVSASTWSWMLNSESGVVNTLLGALGVGPVNWLTSPSWSLTSVIIANIWIGVPFNLVVLHSGLQSIPAGLYEAAALDGAGAWQPLLAHHLPAAAPGLRDHAAAGPRLHAQGLRHHLDHDQGRSRRTRPPPSPPGPTDSASATCCPPSAREPPWATCWWLPPWSSA